MKRRDFLRAATATAIAACAPTTTPGPTGDVFESMSLERKVGQLMSVAFHGTRITSSLEAMVRERGVGGVILYSENFTDAASLKQLIADLSGIARDAKAIPLFFEIDQEGGAVTRIGSGATVLPGQMALAATPDPTASITKAVAVTAAELTAVGVNWNFAPDADVNDEPANPVIGNRSFSSDPGRVSAMVTAAVRAYASANFLACAKHFPGHGSTTVDSHTGLPRIDADRAAIDRVQLAPFRAAIAARVPAIMSAHIVVPALDPTPDLPVTLSKPVLNDLLRTTMGFDGVIVTDDLEMGALASIGEATAGVRAFQAGADYLLFRYDESAPLDAHRRIVEAVRSGTITAARLDESVRRVVNLKRAYSIYLGQRSAPSPDLDADGRIALDLARDSITLLRNRGALPLRSRTLVVAPTNADIAVLPGQPDLGTVFKRKRPDAFVQSIPLHPSPSDVSRAVAAARGVDAVVVGTTDLFAYAEQRQLIAELSRERAPVVMVSLRGPYDIAQQPDVAAYLCAYDGREPSLVAATEVLIGERKPVGSLPVEIPGLFAIGAGLRDFA
jgi:beta-N-acetylhexosaminidase